MEEAVRKVLLKPEVQQAIVKLAMVTPKFVPGIKMESNLRRDIDYWAKVIKASGYSPQ